MPNYDSGVYYDSGALYDSNVTPSQPVFNGSLYWSLLIQWDGANWSDESQYLTMITQVERGREFWVSRNGQGIEQSQPGTALFQLDNTAGRFDAYNASSPIYPNVRPNVAVQILVKDLEADITYPVFTGWITNLQALDVSTVQVDASDDLETLNRNDANINILFKSTIGVGIKAILTALGMDSSGIDSTAQPLQVFGADGENALAVLNELTNASLGELFVDRAGKVRYYAYNHNSQPTYAIDQTEVSKIIQIRQPWEELRNDITVFANGYVRSAVKVIWAASSDVVVPAGSSLTIRAQWSGLCQPIALEAGVDFDNNGYLVMGVGVVRVMSASISDITAKGCVVTISNSGIYDMGTKLQVRGREYVQSMTKKQRAPDYFYTPQPDETITVSTRRPYTAWDSSVPVRRRAKFSLDSRYLHDGNFANFFAGALKDWLKGGAKNPHILIENRPDLQFGPELMDKIHTDFDYYNIDDVYKLGRVIHRWLRPGGQAVQTEMFLVNPFYSTSIPTPEPVPDEPPDIPGDTGGGNGGTGSGGGIANCLYNAPYNATPIALTGTLYNYGPQSVASAAHTAICRGNAAYVNPTKFRLSGTVEETVDGGLTWTPSSSNITISLFTKSGTAVSYGTYTYSGGTVESTFTTSQTGVFDIVQVSMELGTGVATVLTSNSEFTSDVSGWTGGSPGDLAWVNSYAGKAGLAQITNNIGGGYRGSIAQTIALPAGQYRALVEGLNDTNPGNGFQLDATYDGILHYTTIGGSGWTESYMDFTLTTGQNVQVSLEVNPFAAARTVVGYLNYFRLINMGSVIGNKRMTITSFELLNLCPA